MSEKDPEEMTEEEAKKEIERLLLYAGKMLNKIQRDQRLDKRSFYRTFEWMGAFAVCRKCVACDHRGGQ